MTRRDELVARGASFRLGAFRAEQVFLQALQIAPDIPPAIAGLKAIRKNGLYGGIEAKYNTYLLP